MFNHRDKSAGPFEEHISDCVPDVARYKGCLDLKL
jgi:hypothetical protein